MKPYGTGTTLNWLNTTPSDWLDQYMPGWRQSTYGDLLQARPADWLRWLQTVYPTQAWAPSSYPPYGPPLGFQRGSRMPGRRFGRDWGGCESRGCECETCRPEDCECRCCIGDVDLVVYAHAGEQRIVPVVVENERRREREVKVELGAWHSRGGGASLVQTIDVEPKAFTLPPCGKKEIIISLRIDRPPHEQHPNEPKHEHHDVDCCVVAYADLTLVGCDHRCLRIAIAILPRFCSPLYVGCGCGCC